MLMHFFGTEQGNPVDPGNPNLGKHVFVADTGVRKGPIVRQVDRILIESSDPTALFAFLRRIFSCRKPGRLRKIRGMLAVRWAPGM
jgi:hypothetical protein